MEALKNFNSYLNWVDVTQQFQNCAKGIFQLCL